MLKVIFIDLRNKEQVDWWNKYASNKITLIYDRSTGHYYEMRRKPKTSEWLRIEEENKKGKPLGWILNDMKLLK